MSERLDLISGRTVSITYRSIVPRRVQGDLFTFAFEADHWCILNYTFHETSPSRSATGTPSSADRKWNPATFLNIKLGESTENDLTAKFGKPSYRGRADEGDDEASSTYGPRDAISLEFPNSLDDKGRAGTLTFFLGPEIKGRRTVREADFVFASPLTLDQAISAFGDDFFQIELAGSSCVGDDVQQGVVNKALRYPALVYPNKGLTVVQNYVTKKVHYYYYSLDCDPRKMTNK